MDLWQLRTLSVVAKTLNFTRASEELNLSQPAVSQQIKALEQEIGEQLFLRGKEGVTLTQSGKSAYEHARKILDIADDLKADLKDRSGAISGKIVLGASFKGLDNPFYGIYLKFRENYNDVELVFQGENSPEDVIEKIKLGEIDLGLVSDEFLSPQLESIPYGEYRFHLVVGRGHRLAEMESVKPSELANEDWVLFDKTSRFRHYTEECFKKTNFKPKSVFETNDGSLITSMVSRGDFISCLPAWGVFESSGDGDIKPVNVKGWGREIRVSLVWNPSRFPPVLRVLVRFLLNVEIEGVSLFRLELD